MFIAFEHMLGYVQRILPSERLWSQRITPGKSAVLQQNELTPRDSTATATVTRRWCRIFCVHSIEPCAAYGVQVWFCCIVQFIYMYVQ